MFDSHLLLNCHLIEFLTTLQNFNKLMQYNCVTITKLIPNDVPILLQHVQIVYPELWLEHDRECAIQRHNYIQLCILDCYVFICKALFARLFGCCYANLPPGVQTREIQCLRIKDSQSVKNKNSTANKPKCTIQYKLLYKAKARGIWRQKASNILISNTA